MFSALSPVSGRQRLDFKFIISSESFPNVEQNLLSAAITKLRRAAISVAGNPLSDLQNPSVLQIVRNAGRPEGVGGVIPNNARVFQSSFQQISSIKPSLVEIQAPDFAKCRWEQRRVRPSRSFETLRYSFRISSSLW